MDLIVSYKNKEPGALNQLVDLLLKQGTAVTFEINDNRQYTIDCYAENNTPVSVKISLDGMLKLLELLKQATGISSTLKSKCFRSHLTPLLRKTI